MKGPNFAEGITRFRAASHSARTVRSCRRRSAEAGDACCRGRRGSPRVRLEDSAHHVREPSVEASTSWNSSKISAAASCGLPPSRPAARAASRSSRRFGARAGRLEGESERPVVGSTSIVGRIEGRGRARRLSRVPDRQVRRGRRRSSSQGRRRTVLSSASSSGRSSRPDAFASASSAARSTSDDLPYLAGRRPARPGRSACRR